MDELEQAITVAVKTCGTCSSGLLDCDNFCRWCGAAQACHQVSMSVGTDESAGPVACSVACNAASYATVALAERTDVYRRISGPLVNAVATGAVLGPSSQNQSVFIKRLILALISIPVWLIIVLLSPLDAYAAVKNLARQV